MYYVSCFLRNNENIKPRKLLEGFRGSKGPTLTNCGKTEFSRFSLYVIWLGCIRVLSLSLSLSPFPPLAGYRADLCTSNPNCGVPGLDERSRLDAVAE